MKDEARDATRDLLDSEVNGVSGALRAMYRRALRIIDEADDVQEAARMLSQEAASARASNRSKAAVLAEVLDTIAATLSGELESEPLLGAVGDETLSDDDDDPSEVSVSDLLEEYNSKEEEATDE